MKRDTPNFQFPPGKPPRSSLTLQQLYQLAQHFAQEYPISPSKRGRPTRYSEPMILALWLFKQLNQLSYRQLHCQIKSLSETIPNFSTLHYRFDRISADRLAKFNLWVTQQLAEEETSPSASE